MFARVLEFVPKTEKRDDLTRVMKNEILPILNKQNGFLEMIPFFPENKNEKALVISLWTEKRYADTYANEWFSKVQDMVKPHLTTPITVNHYTVETTVCQHFEKALIA